MSDFFGNLLAKNTAPRPGLPPGKPSAGSLRPRPIISFELLPPAPLDLPVEQPGIERTLQIEDGQAAGRQRSHALEPQAPLRPPEPIETASSLALPPLVAPPLLETSAPAVSPPQAATAQAVSPPRASAPPAVPLLPASATQAEPERSLADALEPLPLASAPQVRRRAQGAPPSVSQTVPGETPEAPPPSEVKPRERGPIALRNAATQTKKAAPKERQARTERLPQSTPPAAAQANTPARPPEERGAPHGWPPALVDLTIRLAGPQRIPAAPFAPPAAPSPRTVEEAADRPQEEPVLPTRAAPAKRENNRIFDVPRAPERVAGPPPILAQTGAQPPSASLPEGPVLRPAQAASLPEPARAAETAPTIQVSIGRIEVRAVPPTPQGAASKERRPAAVMSLEDYLRMREGGKP